MAIAGLFWWRFNAPPGSTGDLFPFDLLNYYLPVTDLAASQVRAGALPLWNPYHCGGLPLLATLQVGVFYPLTWLALAMPTDQAMVVRAAIETALAGLFTCWLLRSWGYRWVAAAGGASLYVFVFALGRSLWPASLSTLVWWPVLILCVDRVVEGGGWRAWVGLSLAAALQLLAGFPQFVLYGGYLLAAYVLLRLVQQLRAGAGRAAVARTLAKLGAAALVAGLIAGAQLIPTLELVRESSRGAGLDSAEVQYQGPPLSNGKLLRNALDPEPKVPFFSYLDRAGYVGTATLLLMVVGLVAGRHRARLWLIFGVGGVALALSEAHHGPFGRFYDLLPGAGMFRDTERLRMLTFFAALVLAAAGLDQVARGFSGLRQRWLGVVGAVGVVLLSLAVFRIGGDGASTRWLVALALAGVVLLWGRRRPAVASACAVAMLVLLIGDLYLALRPNVGSLRSLPVAWAQSYSKGHVFLDDPEIAELEQRLDGKRLALSGLMPKMGRVPNDELLHLSCQEPLAPARISALHRQLTGSIPHYALEVFPGRRAATLYDVFSVGLAGRLTPPLRRPGPRRGAGPRPAPHPKSRLLLEANPDALPRAYVATRYLVSEPSASLEKISQNQLDPWQEVLIDRPPAMDSRPGRHRPAEIVEYSSTRVEIDAVAPLGGGLLVLTDTAYPGWRATVDGQRAEVSTANGLFRAVELPAGAHRVIFEYRPRSVTLGLASSGAGLLALLLAPWLAGRRRGESKEISCAVCGHETMQLALHKGPVEIVACAECGLRSWQPEEGFDPASVYDKSYFTDAGADSGYDDYASLAEAFRLSFSKRLSRLPLPRAEADLLDVGAAYGFAMQQAARLGWRAYGAELSIAATAEAAERMPGRVTVASASELPYADQSFDTVTLWDVIEHLPDPHGSIAEAARVLRPGGRLVLTTGDVGSLLAKVSGSRWHLYTLPEHLFFYSRRSLKVLLEAHGFRVESMRARASFYTLGYLVERLGKTLFGGKLRGRGWPGAKIRLPVNLFDIVTVSAVREPPEP